MTRLIYRGIKHDGQRSAKVRTAKDLIYRGLVHDGMTTASAARRSSAPMCYRGIRYAVQADGAITAVNSAQASGSAGAEAMQVV